MRVCIDALPLLVRSAGVKNYLYYWIEHLRRAAGPDAVRLFPPLRLGPLDHERSIAGPLRTALGLASLSIINRTNVPLERWLPRGCGLFHCSNLLRRPPSGVRVTTTLHDVTTWMFPELHSRGNRRADERFERLLRSAAGIIAVSAHTRDDAVRVLKLNPDRIAVIHSGVARAFFRVTGEDAAAAARKLALHRPYALFVGAIEPRKNISALLDAWAALSSDLRAEFELVIAGSRGWAAGDLLARLASPPAGVRCLGYVPEPDLPGLTAGATVFVYPSLYEGFGFPVAQAMAAGVPVVTSNVSSLPEIAGEAAVLVDPRSPSELRDALATLLTSPSQRTRLAALARDRATRFTWDECARRSLQFFSTVLESPVPVKP